jgi:putative inorganic carbon (hco3(-)) transporter
MGYFLFLLVTATLFVRPAEIFPVFHAPIYEYLILACLAVSLPAVLKQLTATSLCENPITACVIGLWAAVVLSHLSHASIWGARSSGFMFFKIVVYYLLLVANVDSEERIKSFLRWLLLLITLVASLGLLSANNVIELAGGDFLEQRQDDKESGETIVIPRLRGTGIFNDPNDLAMIMVAGVVIAIHFTADPAGGILRPLGPALVGLFAYEIYGTQSRGGLFALMGALLTLCCTRWGWRRAALIAAIAIPMLLVVFKGRMTDINDAMGEGTGMGRVQIWAEGLALFRQQPIFGIGCDTYVDEVGYVAHNSFIHCYTEIGFFGGTFLFGAFLAGAGMLRRLREVHASLGNEGLARALPCIMAILVGFAVSMFSISRAYVVPPYLILGFVTAYTRVAVEQSGAAPFRFDSTFLRRLIIGSVCFIVAVIVGVRVLVHWT